VTVSPHVKSTGISVLPAEGEIYATEKLTLKYTLVSEVEGVKSNDDVVWSSSDKKIAKVTTKGVVTGVGYGVAKITATAESGHAASAEIVVNTIKSKASKVIITPGMYYKTGFLLYGTDASEGVTYSSSDKSIATVTAEGNVYANLRDKSTGVAKAGTVTITAKTKSGDKASVKVVVRDEPTIIDISKWQGEIDWAKASKSTDLAILRVMYGADTTTELKYPSYADSCDEYGVPFAAYAYVTYKTKASAEKQAKVFYDQAVSDGREPLFFVVDAEESYITRANTEAYIAKLRSLAKADGINRLKVGVYIGHHLYNSLKLNLTTDTSNAKTPDFVWIPRYNSNIGARTSSMSVPDFACDIWQYSSAGRIPGFSGNIDVNSLTDVDGEVLTEKAGFDFSWLVAGSDVG
jgi:GH25 family lysozyme M1 (1,4-beta-N-acetylmuramidase)